MGPYEPILSFSSEEEAEAFVSQDVEQICNLTCTCMRFSLEEADRISRKNAVALAARTSPEALTLAERIFKTSNPLE